MKFKTMIPLLAVLSIVGCSKNGPDSPAAAPNTVGAPPSQPEPKPAGPVVETPNAFSKFMGDDSCDVTLTGRVGDYVEYSNEGVSRIFDISLKLFKGGGYELQVDNYVHHFPRYTQDYTSTSMLYRSSGWEIRGETLVLSNSANTTAALKTEESSGHSDKLLMKVLDPELVNAGLLEPVDLQMKRDCKQK